MPVIWVIYKIPDKKYNWNQRKEEDFLLTLFLPGKIHRNEKKCIELY